MKEIAHTYGISESHVIMSLAERVGAAAWKKKIVSGLGQTHLDPVYRLFRMLLDFLWKCTDKPSMTIYNKSVPHVHGEIGHDNIYLSSCVTRLK